MGTALALVGASSLVLAAGASAAEFHPTNEVQLEEAVTTANGNAQANKIVLAGQRSEVYRPHATLHLTDTAGVQTIEGPSTEPGAELEGGAVEPFPSSILTVESGVSAALNKVSVATGGGLTTPAIEDSGTLTLEGDAISGNNYTGVLVPAGGTLTARNTTISGSSGAPGVIDDGTASLFNSTVAFNQLGGVENAGTLHLTNTIVAENHLNGQSGKDCLAKAATTSDHSLDSDGSCGVGTLSKVNPLLQKQLRFDGGSTEVHSLTLGSPAIDAGDKTTCLTTDQSGSPRPDIPGTACDIGADEFNATPVPSFATTFTAPTNLQGSFKQPDAVAVDPSGNIWVADSGHNRVLEFNKERKFLRQFGTEGTGPGQFSGIQGIATNSAGDVYVTDAKNDRVQEFSPTGAFVRQFGGPGSGNGQFFFPNGIAVDSSGNVWVLDTFNYRVQEFSESGAFLKAFGSRGTENGQFGWASGLAFSGGNLYVADTARVEEFSTAGTFIATFGSSGTGNGQFHGLGGIATDPTTGDLYVSDTANNRVQEFTAAGAFIAAVGSGGSGNSQFSAPIGVAVSSLGTLYVADSGNNRVHEWLGGS
jgi:hypothetical protein